MNAARVRFNPFDPDVRRDPYPLYRRLRETDAVHRSLGMWVLTRHADVRTVLADRTFSAGLIPDLVARRIDRQDDPGSYYRIARLGRKSLVFTDNPDHARLRGLVNRVFTPRAVQALRPVVEDVAGDLVARARADGAMDAVAGFAGPLPVRVLCAAMDLPAEVSDRVGAWTHDVRFLLEPGLMTPADLVRVRDVVEEFSGALTGVLAHRRAHPGEDLLSRLLAARTGAGDALDHEEIVFVAIMCFVAGNETTTALVGNLLLALLRNPEQDALLRRRPGLVRGAVDEALRYDSPLQLTKRVPTRDVEIGGVPIAAGEQVLLCLGAANRDPAAFDRPDEFDITRTAPGHVGFGHGMHGCLGAALATLVAEVAVGALYRTGARLRPSGAEITWQQHSGIVRGPAHLPVDLSEPTTGPSTGTAGDAG
ncbi:hypothetical protein EV383_3735 [Pseudonocardia sediminis]|uniref:Cytochrome P450 n=1 Tax=Pseudonocardia sediminis TaxID=1397368 RepID=A0A4Q7UY35_PSEST|nr:cytochrome P450 [Pseudonocardia sediminis]RZT86836.1 hypothetical protein EV383_3735 [Pseudonocardia sediminis]